MPVESLRMEHKISTEILLNAFRLMTTVKSLTEKYEANAKLTSKYVHATARGHEAVQIALGLQMTPKDFLSLYYRDDAVLLGLGLTP